MNMKIGTFDWVTAVDDIKHIFKPEITRVINPADTRVLIVGCGTSKLSEHLADIYGDIVSVDNDADVISHMESRVQRSNIKWIVHDMIENYEKCDVFLDSCLQVKFDIIVDKCSLDAMLVEGSVAQLFCEIHRLLKPQGIYILCSLHSKYLMQSFLTMPSLMFQLVRGIF